MTSQGETPCEHCGGTGIEPWILISQIAVPMLTVSINHQGKLKERMARKKDQRESVTAHLWGMFGRQTGKKWVVAHAPLRVVMVRRGPRRLDSDNLAASCKHARDAIAEWFGVDDGKDEVVSYDTKQIVVRDLPSVEIRFYKRRS